MCSKCLWAGTTCGTCCMRTAQLRWNGDRGKGIATLLALGTYAPLWSFSHESHRSWSRSLIHRRPLHQFLQKEGCVKLNTQLSSYKLTFKAREQLSWANNTFRNFHSIPIFPSPALTQRQKELKYFLGWNYSKDYITNSLNVSLNMILSNCYKVQTLTTSALSLACPTNLSVHSE